jgi:tetraacyldisaccharide 4'-kinase
LRRRRLQQVSIDQLVRTDALLKIGTANGADKLVRNAARAAKPVYEAVLKPKALEGIADRPLLAFAGIGDPSKFFRTLEEAGAKVEQTRSFPDHHPYKDEDVADLVRDAGKDGLTLITTAKDQVRLLDGSPAVKEFASRVLVLEVELVFSHPQTALRIIRETRDRARVRSLKRS